MISDPLQLDVSDPVNRDAVQAALDEVLSVDPVHEPFLRRVLTACSDEVLTGQARVLLAAFEQSRGHNSDAAALYRAGLPMVWGSGTRAEANALVNYALVCLLQRRNFEGLVLLRRFAEYAERLDNLDAQALGKAYVARTLVELEDWERLDPLLAELEELLPSLDVARRPYVEMVVVTTAIEAAYRRKGSAPPASPLDRLEQLDFEDDVRALPYHRAIIHATAGRTAEAIEQIELVRSLPPGPEPYIAATLDIEIACRAEATPVDQLRPQIVELLDLLEGAGLDEHSAGDCLVMASRLVRLLARRGDVDDLAARALRVAAGGTIERIAELERFLRALPQLCFAGPREQVILDDYRARFLARHEEILDAARAMLDAAPDETTAFDATAHGDPMWVCVCAWCRLLRGPDGLWLPARELDVPSGAVRVTHGICQRCRGIELRRLRGRG